MRIFAYIIVLTLSMGESMVNGAIPRNEDGSLPNFIIMLMDDVSYCSK